MRDGVLRALYVIWLVGCAGGMQAQSSSTPPPTGQPGYTLQMSTRIVLTDVTVTDKHGNPVRGLNRSAFQIFDNGQPQQIASFAEHTGEETPAISPPLAANEFSNSFLRHPPPVFDVLLLDVTTIHIVDQMYLAEQLDKFVDALPSGQPIAVYTRAGDFVVMVQDFTADHALLHAAIHKAIPRLQQPGSWAASDLDTLQQMFGFLRPYPGRKDLIWFSGGSNLALFADVTGAPAYVNMQPIYDQLESTRIAVYPVDARGLTVELRGSMIYQQMMMRQTANATGGEAFFNNNGLRQIAARIVNDSSSFYTITYSPREQKLDNKWHKVKVKVGDGSYELSYRPGYYDDGSNVRPPSGGQRTVLRADGSSQRRQPDVLKAPIIFTTTVLPSASLPAQTAAIPGTTLPLPAPKKNQTTYDIHYTLPAADFTQKTVDGRQEVAIGTGLLGVDRLGSQVARQVDAVTVRIDAEKLRANPQGTIGFDERINLPKGQDFVYILVWDEASGRYGMVQVPLTVPKRRD